MTVSTSFDGLKPTALSVPAGDRSKWMISAFAKAIARRRKTETEYPFIFAFLFERCLLYHDGGLCPDCAGAASRENIGLLPRGAQTGKWLICRSSMPLRLNRSQNRHSSDANL